MNRVTVGEDFWRGNAVARSEIRNKDEGAHFRTDALNSLYPRSEVEGVALP